jgi:hypothetical protein
VRGNRLNIERWPVCVCVGVCVCVCGGGGTADDTHLYSFSFNFVVKFMKIAGLIEAT